MSKVVNNTERAVIVGGALLIPGKAHEITDIEGTKKRYPDFAKMIDSGEVSVTGGNAAGSGAEPAKEESKRGKGK